MSLKSDVRTGTLTLCIVMVTSGISCAEGPTSVPEREAAADVLTPQETCYIVNDRLICTSVGTVATPVPRTR